MASMPLCWEQLKLLTLAIKFCHLVIASSFELVWLVLLSWKGSKRKGFKMQHRDFFPLVRFCLIITAAECLAKVRNLLFPLREQRNKSSGGPAQTNGGPFFYLLKEKLIRIYFRNNSVLSQAGRWWNKNERKWNGGNYHKNVKFYLKNPTKYIS